MAENFTPPPYDYQLPLHAFDFLIFNFWLFLTSHNVKLLIPTHGLWYAPKLFDRLKCESKVKIAKIPQVRTPAILGPHNFAWKNPIEMKSEAKL